MLLNILQCARQSPMTKNYFIPNVSSAKVLKPCLGSCDFCFRMKNSYGSLTILYSPFYSFLYIKMGPDHPCLQGNIVYFIDSHQCYFHFLSSLNRKSAGRYCLQFCSCKLYILSLISFLLSKKSLFLMPFKRLFFHLLIP